MTGSLLMVVAHPDDEVIGAGNHLANLSSDPRSRTVITYVTDGAPKDLRWTIAAGFKTRRDYSEARRRERDAALEIAGITPDHCRELGCEDQEAARHLIEITNMIRGLLVELQPNIILTHPYEGGHPDHDACAFACRHAIESLAHNARPELWEFACYHGCPNGFHAQEFLPDQPCEQLLISLNDEQRRRKQRILDCHRTQKDVLQQFSTRDEKFRIAPLYDFCSSPHSGPLHYETLGWQMTGSTWRALAKEALETLSCRT